MARAFPGRLLLVLLLVALSGACATGKRWQQDKLDQLEQSIRAREFGRAVALVERYPEVLDDGRALGLAIRIGDPQAIQYFVMRTGVDIELDVDGTTPLIRSITAAPPEARARVVATLLRLGADPARADKYGNTAPDLARRRGEQALLEMMLPQEARASGGPSATATWLPDNTAADAAGRPVAGPRRADPVRPEQLSKDLWTARADDPRRIGPVAAFRFHADGTGQLLKQYVRPNRLEPVGGALLAWALEDGRFSFFVLSSEFSARCEGQSASDTEMRIACTDYRFPGSQSSATLSSTLSLDDARIMLGSYAGRPTMVAGNTSNAILQANRDMACKPRTPSAAATAVPPVRGQAMGDWYAFDPQQMAIFAPMTGNACLQSEARGAALADCSRHGGHCVGVGGCPVGQASAVAAVRGHRWAWVGCDPSADRAKRKALEKCRKNAGCDCQLQALNGGNVNTVRQAACQTNSGFKSAASAR